ncbi:beta-lactamase/transpeptidase-like protein [Dendrothele bispora CBS 962.96]|uniref:Beta-lactamase/transpeptidase-like protein n=1 Tax=Dendrothele bispora (strain CBS 962.96) TaxID=1314807 RepID=A0A4S8MZH2_DENBC|nr:beta-lactamase/transpeptidase-like protein [Dendrothele bispora CBS 962.96]
MFLRQVFVLLTSLGICVVYARQVPLNTTQASHNRTRNVLTPKIDHFVEQILNDWNSAAGVGLAVVQMNEDKTWNVETKGYGTAKGDGSKVTEDTYFFIGSNSKLFDVFAIGLLISNESLFPRVSWDTQIASVLPEWGLQDSIASSESTILDLMGHRTGLPDHDLMYESNTNMSDLLSRSKHLRPSVGFRRQFQYNNIMYTILSYLPKALIPSLSSYAGYVKDNIFIPLGMNQTTFDSSMIEKSGYLAQGFARDKVNKTEDLFGKGTTRVLPSWNPSNEDGNMISGAGGILMTIRDAATWLQTLLLFGKNPVNGNIIIPSDVVQKAATGISVVSGSAVWPELSPVVYGGGQAMYSYRGHGFKSCISRFPFDNVGVAVFTNDDSYGGSIATIITMRILDEVFGLEVIDWNTRVKFITSILYEQRVSRMVPRPSEPQSPSVPMSTIMGTYKNPAYGTLELCLVPQSVEGEGLQSDSCRVLLDEIPFRLPGAINTRVPTFVARWDKLWVSHFKLEHFSNNLFNASVLTSYPIIDASTENPDDGQEYWAQVLSPFDTPPMAEIAIEGDIVVGLGIVGMWGAGQDVQSPRGNDIEERAEIWFAKDT